MGAVGGVAILGGNFEAATFPEDKVVQRSLTAGTQENSPIDAIILDALPLGAPGQLDSHAFLWKGHSNNGSPHTIDWKAFVNVTADDGTGSLWTLQTRIDGAPFTDILTVDDNGLLTVSGATFTMDQLIIDSDNTEAVLVRKDGDAGDVFIVDTVNDVVRLGSDNTLFTFGAASDVVFRREAAGIISLVDPGSSIASGTQQELRIVSFDIVGEERYLEIIADRSGNGEVLIKAVRASGGGQYDLKFDVSVGALEFFNEGVERWSIQGSVTADFEFAPFITDRYDLGSASFAVRNLFTNGVFIGQDKVSGGFNAITIDHADLTGDANQDSGAILLTGKGFETATPHDIDWKFFVNVTADDGTGSLFTWQTQIDTAGFVNRLTLDDAGRMDIIGTTGSIILDNSGDIVASPAIWLGTAAPIASNFTFRMISDTLLFINAATSVAFQIGTAQFGSFSSIDQQWTFNRRLLFTVAGVTEGIILDSPDLTSDGQQDSHSILWTGQGFETSTQHDIDWKLFVDVTADDGTGSIFTLQTRIDAAGFVTVFEIDDTGNLTIPGSFIVDGLIIDVDSVEAFLVRMDGDAGDVFIVDTINEAVRLAQDDTFLTFGAASDVQLHRDGADILALRRGTNDQFFYVYATFTDLSNYERLAIYAGGQAQFFIEAQTAGTGQDDAILDIRGAGSGGQILLKPGAASVNYNFLGTVFNVNPQNTLDLGNPGGGQFRTGHFGTSVKVGTSVTAGDGFILDTAALGSPGVRDSLSVLWTGKSHDGSPHDVDWKAFVAPVNNDGTGSLFTISSRIDAVAFVDEFTITSTTSPTLMSIGPGSTGGAIAFGPTPASQGTLRFANADSIFFRNANNNGDLAVLSSPQSDEFDMFNTGTPRVTFKQVRSTFEKIVNVHTVGSNTSAFSVGSALVIDTTNGIVKAQQSLAIGSAPAQTGGLRLSNADDIVWRNSANSGDNVWFSIGASDELILGESTTGPFIRVAEELRCFAGLTATLDSAAAFRVTGANLSPIVFKVDTISEAVTIGEGVVLLPSSSVDRLIIDAPNLTVNSTVGFSHTLLFVGKSRESGGANHDANWRMFVSPLSTTGFDGQSLFRMNAAIDGAIPTELMRMADDGRVAFSQPEQFSIGSPTFVDNVQVHITGSFIDDYGGGPDSTYKVLVDGFQTGDATRTARQCLFAVSPPGNGAQIITQNNSESISDVGTMLLGPASIVKGTDTITRTFTLKVANAPATGVGTENYVVLLDQSSSSPPDAVLRIGQAQSLGVKLLVAGLGSTNLVQNAQVRFSSVYQPAPAVADFASLLHIDAQLNGVSGDTNHLTGALFTANVVTQGVTESISNISQVQIDEPTITNNLTGTITQASTVLITGAPTEATRNYALNVEDGSVRFALAGPHVMGGVPQNLFQFAMVGSFTSGGAGIQAANLRVAANLGGAPGDTLRLAGTDLASIIVTQSASESIADVAQLIVLEPDISDNLTGGGVITNASTVLIQGAPTEGANNFALRVTSGATFLGGKVKIAVNDAEALFIQKAGGGGPGQDIFKVDTSASGFPPGNLVRVIGASFLQETASGRNTFGTSTAFDYVFLRIAPSQVISGGASDEAHILLVEGNIQGFSGDTARINVATFTGSVTTQNVAEAVANISQVQIDEPAITLQGSSTVTNAQTLLITGAPTEGVDNWAFRIISGDVEIGGDLIAFGAGGGNSRILFRGCGTYYVGNLDTPDELFIGIDAGSGNVTVASSVVSTDGNSWKFRNSAPNGQFMEVRQAFTTVLTSAGSSVTAAGAIPSGSFVVGITTRVITAVTGPTGFDVGDGIDVDRWGASIAATLNTTSDITDYTSSALNLFPASNDVVITSDGVDFTGGEIRITIHYMSLQAPSS